MELFKDTLQITIALLGLPIRLARRFGGIIIRIGWRRTLLAVLVLAVLLTVAATAFIKVTSQPQFCVSCHYMKPYFASWKESKHKDVHCTKCHFPPGIKHTLEGKFTALSMLVNYATGIYKRSKPWAEISDESCLRGGCHERRLLEGRVEFKQGIIFDHKPHLTQLRHGKTLRCTSCHSQIVQGAHISVTSSTCFICHFKGSEGERMSGCTTCHDAPVRTAAKEDVPFNHTQMLERKTSCLRCHGNMQVGSGDVLKERCNSCHAELGKIERFGDTELIHDNHITKRKVECQVCHQEIIHRSVSRTELVKPRCEDCHVGFHEVQVDLFTGKGGKGVAPHPSTMFQSGLNCRGCHTIQEAADDFALKGVTYKASGVVCTPCHDQGYDRILLGWKRRNMERLAQIEGIERTVESAVRGLGSERRTSADSLLNAASQNIKMVDLGHGIHNIPYAEALLGAAYRQLQSAYQLAGGGALARFEVGLPKQGADCMNCHYGVETMVVQRLGRSFPHAPHVLGQKLACTTCHSNEIKHGSRTLGPAACNQCHHQAEGGTAPVCAPCHSLQASLFTGDSTWGSETIPDPMFEAGLSCADCHIQGEGLVQLPSGEACIACHRPGYEKLLETWHGDYTASLATVDSLLHLCRNVELPDLDAVKRRVERIRADRSRGVHNHALVGETLKGEEKWLRKFVIEHELGVTTPTAKP